MRETLKKKLKSRTERSEIDWSEATTDNGQLFSAEQRAGGVAAGGGDAEAEKMKSCRLSVVCCLLSVEDEELSVVGCLRSRRAVQQLHDA